MFECYLPFQDNKLNVYRREATKEVTNKLGIPQAWQQCQERKNRELKAMRQEKGPRTCVTLKNEVQAMVRMQKEEEILTLYGAGDAVAVPALQHFIMEAATWNRLTSSEKDATYEAFKKAPFSKCSNSS